MEVRPKANCFLRADMVEYLSAELRVGFKRGHRLVYGHGDLVISAPARTTASSNTQAN